MSFSFCQTVENVSEKLFSLKNYFSWKIIFWENDFHPYQTHPKRS